MNHADIAAHNAMAATPKPAWTPAPVRQPNRFWPERGDWGPFKFWLTVNACEWTYFFYLIWSR